MTYKNLTDLSPGNSTSTPLAGGATFTGTKEYSPLPDVMVTVKADVAGTLYIDFSIDDGANWDTSIPFTVAAGVGEFHTAVKGPRHCRVRFVNGSSAQSYMRLQTSFGVYRQPNQAGKSIIQLDVDAISVRPSDYKFEVARGLRSGAVVWNKFGYNDDIDVGTEVVAEFGGPFTPLEAASTLSIVSTSTSDDVGSTGATGVVVYGVDANWATQTEVVFLDGTTPVITTSTWLGINRMSVYAAGTEKQNVGTITATAVTGGAIQATLPAGEGTSQQAIFFVKASAQALMTYLFFNVEKFTIGTDPIATFKLWVYSAVSNAKYEVTRYLLNAGVQQSAQLTFPTPLIIGEKSAMWIECTTTQNNTSTSARFSLVLVDN